MSTKIYEKLAEVFEKVFDEDEIEINENTTAADVDGWDSLHHMQLIMAIEKTFSVRFGATEIAGLKKVGDVVELIRQKSGTWK